VAVDDDYENTSLFEEEDDEPEPVEKWFIRIPKWWINFA
jgi:hypothetical protein